MNLKDRDGKKLIFSLFQSIGWNVICVVTGLLQLLAMFLFVSLNKKAAGMNIDKIFSDGVILFFCSAVILTTVIDYYSLKYRWPKLFEGFFFFAVPVGVIFLTIILYCATMGYGDDIDIDLLKQLTYMCFIVVISHSIVFRTIKIYSGSLR
jgi:hypothetical protein